MWGNTKGGRSRAGRRTRSVTIKDLSAELKLSITTISRALNGYPDVGEATRARVMEAAGRMGYRPNRNAQRLVTQRTRNIAWVQEDNDRKFVDPHFAEVMSGVLRGARAAGYDIVITSATPDEQISAYERYTMDNSVDGFIVDLPRPDDPRITYLLDMDQPFVVHGREDRMARYGWVDVDNYGNFHDLTRLLIANGHRDIAFINGDERFVFALDRRRAVAAAAADMGLPPERIRFLNARHPMGDAGFQLTQQALDDGRVTALIYSSALMAVEGHSALVRAGLKAGADIAVASMDDQLHYLDLSPFEGVFSFVRSSLSAAGGALMQTLVRACEHKDIPPGTLLPSRFVIARGMDAGILDTPRRTGAEERE